MEEATPLLRNRPGSDEAQEQSTPIVATRLASVMAIVCLSDVATYFGAALSAAPRIKVLESSICKSVLGRFPGPGDQAACKGPLVQDELAALVGWMQTVDQLPGLALALVYGLAANRLGPKPILVLALVGHAMQAMATLGIMWWNYHQGTVPLRAILLTPVLQIVGGGLSTASSMSYAIITETYSSGDWVSRYLVLGAATMIGDVVATSLAALLMTWTPWAPLLAAIGFYFLGIIAAACLPARPQVPAADSYATGPRERYDDSNAASEPSQAVSTREGKTRWKCGLNLKVSVFSLNTSIVFAAIAFLLTSIGISSLSFVTQYASKQFSWSIAKASLLMSVRGAINLLCLLVILPSISTMLDSRLTPLAKDLYIVQGSAFCGALGFALMGFASQASVFILGICILSFGAGFAAALRSLANSLAIASWISFTNAAFGVAIHCGTLVAGPLFASALQKGLQWQGAWSGLPFIIAASLYLAAACLIWCGRDLPGHSVEQ